MGEVKEKRRQLSKEERNMCESQITSRLNAIEWETYQQEIFERNIEKGLALKFKKDMNDSRMQLMEIVHDLSQHKAIIQELEDQLKNGVIVKTTVKTEDGEIEVQNPDEIKEE